MMADERIMQLTDAQAIAAVNRVVDHWLKSHGSDALRDVERVRVEAERQNIRMPSTLMLERLEQVKPEQGEVARELLLAFADSDDAEVRSWCGGAIEAYSGDHAQVDPFTAALIVTGLFSAMVLVSKIYTGEDGKMKLQKLHKGDIAGIAGVAAAIFGSFVGT
jgi:hypothetical protein